MNLQHQIESAVHQFKQTIMQITRDALTEAFAGNDGPRTHIASNAHSVQPFKPTVLPTTPNTFNGRPKGEKRDPKLLDEVQATFVAFVKKNPGMRIEQINKQLGTTTPDLQLPIRKAIAAGEVKTKGVKRSTTYYIK